MPHQLWIKATLKAKGYKLKDMAETLGITSPRVTDILRGTREVQSDELGPLAAMLGLNLKSLLTSLSQGSLKQVADPDNQLPIAGRLMGDGSILPLLATNGPNHVALPPDAATSDGLYCYVMGDNSMAQEIKAGDIVIAADPRIHFYPMVPGVLLLVRCGAGKLALRQFVKYKPADIDQAADISDNGKQEKQRDSAAKTGNETGENWLVPLPDHPDPKLASWPFDMLPSSLTEADSIPTEETSTLKDADREIAAGETVHTAHIAAAVLWVHRRYRP